MAPVARCVAIWDQNRFWGIIPVEWLACFIPAYVVYVYSLVFYTYLNPGL